MILIFRVKIKPAMNIKPRLTHSLPVQRSAQGANPEYGPYREGYASAGRREISIYILQCGRSKFKNPVQVFDPDGN
jgi:hypothetical protein